MNSLQNDALSYLRRAGILWERRVRKSLNSMCTELEVTLQGQLRTGAEREELLNKWDELSNYQIGTNKPYPPLKKKTCNFYLFYFLFE